MSRTIPLAFISVLVLLGCGRNTDVIHANAGQIVPNPPAIKDRVSADDLTDPAAWKDLGENDHSRYLVVLQCGNHPSPNTNFFSYDASQRVVDIDFVRINKIVAKGVGYAAAKLAENVMQQYSASASGFLTSDGAYSDGFSFDPTRDAPALAQSEREFGQKPILFDLENFVLLQIDNSPLFGVHFASQARYAEAKLGFDRFLHDASQGRPPPSIQGWERPLRDEFNAWRSFPDALIADGMWTATVPVADPIEHVCLIGNFVDVHNEGVLRTSLISWYLVNGDGAVIARTPASRWALSAQQILEREIADEKQLRN